MGVPDQSQIDEARRRAAHYWKKRAQTTFVASDAFYQRVEDVLRERILPRIGHPENVLDIAAGTGRFTVMIAEHAKAVLATDISERFLSELQAAAKARNLQNVRTEVSNAAKDEWSGSVFDLIVCMGFSTILVDGRVFRRFVGKLAKHIAASGLLLMRDTLSTNDEHEYAIVRKKPSTYWAKQRYMRVFLNHGLAPLVTILLQSSPEKKHENVMTLFRRDPAAMQLKTEDVYAQMIDCSGG